MEISHKEALNKVINQFSDAEKSLAESNRYFYIAEKAYLFLKLESEKYRKIDALNQPPIDFDEIDLEILANGCGQVLEGIGLTKEKPFTGLDVQGFNGLFALFHFKNIQRQCKHGFILNGAKGALDCITFQHLVDGTKVIYFNFCEYPSID